MKKLFPLLALCLSALLLLPQGAQASRPQYVDITNSASNTIYVVVVAIDGTSTLYYSNVMAISPGPTLTYYMHAINGTPAISWSGAAPPLGAGSRFYGVEFYEYDPTSPCTPGPAVPGASGCPNFTTATIDIDAGSTPPSSDCMEASGSSCNGFAPNAVVNGSVSYLYWNSMDVLFW